MLERNPDERGTRCDLYPGNECDREGGAERERRSLVPVELLREL